MKESEIRKLLEDAGEGTYLTLTPIQLDPHSFTDIPMVFIKTSGVWNTYDKITASSRGFSSWGVARTIWEFRSKYYWSLS